LDNAAKNEGTNDQSQQGYTKGKHIPYFVNHSFLLFHC